MPIPLGILAVAGAGGGGGLVAAYDLLESVILSSNTTTVTFSNLNTYSDYKHLQLRVVCRSSAATTNTNVQVRFNGDTGSNYATHVLEGNESSVSSDNFTSATSTWPMQGLGTSVPDAWPAGVIDILDFSNTSKTTTIRALSGWAASSGGGAVRRLFLRSGLWNNTAAVTSITLAQSSGDHLSGSRFSLYGIK